MFFVHEYICIIEPLRGESMELVVNGEKRTLPALKNVFELLEHFQLEKKILVIELNRQIIDRERYQESLLTEGDYIEIVHFVGGG
jgi:sulfur carrier protein